MPRKVGEQIVVRLRKLLWTIFMAVLAGSESFAETLEVKIGQDQTSVVSSSYQKSNSQTLALSVLYGRQALGKWSVFAEYRNSFDNTLSAGVLGLAYDTVPLQSKGGYMSPDGSAEISRIPQWLTRFSLGLGAFRFVDILRSNDRSLGTRNLVPVKAVLVGVKLGTSVYRFLTDNWALSIGGAYVVASAGNFGVSSTNLHLGVLYNIN